MVEETILEAVELLFKITNETLRSCSINHYQNTNKEVKTT